MLYSQHQGSQVFSQRIITIGLDQLSTPAADIHLPLSTSDIM